MPYGISANQSDCSTWAAVKIESDGSATTLECYITKQDAVDRMVAQSLAEGLEPTGEVGNQRQMPEQPENGEAEMLEGLADMEEMQINPRQLSLYDFYEKIVENFGEFNQGIGADGAHYVAESPFAEEGMVCANCVFYEGGRGCELVEGDIAPEGICKLWIISENLLPSVEQIVPMETDSNSEYSERSMTNTVQWVAKDIDEKRTIAYSNLEVRAENEGKTIVGYAAVWDSPSEYMGFTEFVKRGAFTKTLNDGADVRLLIDHEGVPLARSKSGTLKLSEDDRGLRVEAELDPANPDAARIMSAMKRGDLSQMSFAFRTVKDSWNADRSIRELREVQLFDVSVVTFPAYEQTVAELRKINEPVTVAPVSTLSLRKNQVALQKLRSR
jgi:HK97 family phage prohead protease